MIVCVKRLAAHNVKVLFATTGLVLLAAQIAGARLRADESASAVAEADPPAAAATGVIEGKVTYEADAKRPWRYGRYYIRDRKVGGLAEAVVALADSHRVQRDATEEPAVTVVDQKDFQFTPETVAIRAGDRVQFTNSDREVHNVRAFHPLHQFNVNMPSRGEHVETFAQAGGIRRPYQIGCVYHSAMRVWVFVFDHPHFQVTGVDGRFRLAGLAPGKYTIEVVHAAGELRRSETVNVVAGDTTQLEIVLSPDDKPKDRASAEVESR